MRCIPSSPFGESSYIQQLLCKSDAAIVSTASDVNSSKVGSFKSFCYATCV